MRTVIVGGALANKPGNGGEAWVRLSWVRGFVRLGLDVGFVEEVAWPPDPVGVAWFRAVTRRFGLGDRATLLAAGRAVVGPALGELQVRAPAAALVNISGHLTEPRLLERFRTRAFVDIDPGFTQVWHAAGDRGARVQGHDVYFTIGSNVGQPDCEIPTGGVTWHTIRQPVVLDDWPVTVTPDPRRFTTVANWRGPYGPISYGGKTYGLKVHEFRRFIELPRRAAGDFEIALAIDPADRADREALVANGWRLVDPLEVTGDPESFRDYVQGSGAEFSVAQGVYVATRSGWFSDRTVRYLASGRPALVQDTGIARTVPVGDGLVTFATLDGAVAGAEDVTRRYAAHAAAARDIAERYFDACRVLPPVCELLGVGV